MRVIAKHAAFYGTRRVKANEEFDLELAKGQKVEDFKWVEVVDQPRRGRRPKAEGEQPDVENPGAE